MEKEALDIPDILKDDNSDVSMPGSSQEEVRAVDRFQDANAGSLAFSRRINKRQRAKDKNQMARVYDAMAREILFTCNHFRTERTLAGRGADTTIKQTCSMRIERSCR